jgi:hypothetical protein
MNQKLSKVKIFTELDSLGEDYSKTVYRTQEDIQNFGCNPKRIVYPS